MKHHIRFNLLLDEGEQAQLSKAAVIAAPIAGKYRTVFRGNSLHIFHAGLSEQVYEIPFSEAKNGEINCTTLHILSSRSIEELEGPGARTSQQYEDRPDSYHFENAGNIVKFILLEGLAERRIPEGMDIRACGERYMKPIYYPFDFINGICDAVLEKKKDPHAFALKMLLSIKHIDISKINELKMEIIFETVYARSAEVKLVYFIWEYINSNKYKCRELYPALRRSRNRDVAAYAKIFRQYWDRKIFPWKGEWGDDDGDRGGDGSGWPPPPPLPVLGLIYLTAANPALDGADYPEAIAFMDGQSYWGGFEYLVVNDLKGCMLAVTGFLVEGLASKLNVLAERPGLPNTQEQTSRIYYRLGNREKALNHVTLSINEYKKRNHQPEDYYHLYLLRALIYAETGKPGKAKADLKKAGEAEFDDTDQLRAKVMEILEEKRKEPLHAKVLVAGCTGLFS